MVHASLIILFCVLIVAAGAGTVIIKTMHDYQGRATYISKEHISTTVGTRLDVEQIYGLGVGDKSVEYLFLKSRLTQGSSPIPLATTLIEVAFEQTTEFYSYNSSIDCSVNPYATGDPSSLSAAEHRQEFGVTYALDRNGDEHADGFVLDDDVIQICLPAAEPVVGSLPMRVIIVSEHASRTVVEFITPDVLPGEWILLYEKLL